MQEPTEQQRHDFEGDEFNPMNVAPRPPELPSTTVDRPTPVVTALTVPARSTENMKPTDISRLPFTALHTGLSVKCLMTGHTGSISEILTDSREFTVRWDQRSLPNKTYRHNAFAMLWVNGLPKSMTA